MDIPNDNPNMAAITECAERIFQCIPEYPQIMNFSNPWHLLGIPELLEIMERMPFDDANNALTHAQFRYSRESGGIPIREGF